MRLHRLIVDCSTPVFVLICFGVVAVAGATAALIIAVLVSLGVVS